MIKVDPSRFKNKPFGPFQVEGTQLIVNDELGSGLFDDRGIGKSKQVIDAACVMYELGIIDTVLICTPAQVKISWLDRELGEIVAHTWVPSTVVDFCSRTPIIPWVEDRLMWVVVSYEYGRMKHAEEKLKCELNGRKTYAVAEEGSFLSSHRSQQTKVFLTLRRDFSVRGTILNGSPQRRDIRNIYPQICWIDPHNKFGYKNFYHFQAKHCRLSTDPKQFKKLLETYDEAELARKINPHILRRTKAEVMPYLPKKIGGIESEGGPQVLTVPLSEATWRLYKQMRDSMVAWLDSKACVVQHAPVKALRLAQLCGGFLGGVEEQDLDQYQLDLGREVRELAVTGKETVQVSSEKVDWVVSQLTHEEQESDDPVRLIIWARFTAELKLLTERLTQAGFDVKRIVGGQDKVSRTEAVHEGMRGDVRRSCVIVGQPQAGSLGLNLVKFWRTLYFSNSDDLLARLQSEDRPHRGNQTETCWYQDVLATGPEGQKTIDFLKLRNLTHKRDMAALTVKDWRRELLEEW